jgi:hypothetical protein
MACTLINRPRSQGRRALFGVPSSAHAIVLTPGGHKVHGTVVDVNHID